MSFTAESQQVSAFVNGILGPAGNHKIDGKKKSTRFIHENPTGVHPVPTALSRKHAMVLS